ncbi:MAG: hypothetical protein K0Q74_817, partial [Gammaproteobacteria bacterium]|nr:hypothetical protein [Gammaproteobacteria bacterium]
VVPFDEKHEETSVEVVSPTLDMKVTLEKVLKEKEVDPDLVMDSLVRLIGINKEIQAIIEQRAVEKNARRYEELLDQKLSLDPILNILKAELKELAADSDYRADIMEFIAQKDLPEDLVQEVLDKITELLEKEAEDALAEEETYMVGPSSSSSSSKEGISESKNDKEESSNVAAVLVAKSPLPSAEPDKAPSSFFGSLFNKKAEANAAKGNVQQDQGTELTIVSPAARAVQMTTWGSDT